MFSDESHQKQMIKMRFALVSHVLPKPLLSGFLKGFHKGKNLIKLVPQWSQLLTTKLSTDEPPDPFVRKYVAPA